MRPVAVGIGVLVIAIILSLTFHNTTLFFKISGAFGLLAFGAAGIVSGAFASGERIRSNFQYQDEKDKLRRQSTAKNLFLMGLPNILAILLYSFKHQ